MHPEGLSSDPNTHVTSRAWFHVLLWPLSAGAHSHTPLHMYVNTHGWEWGNLASHFSKDGKKLMEQKRWSVSHVTAIGTC